MNPPNGDLRPRHQHLSASQRHIAELERENAALRQSGQEINRLLNYLIVHHPTNEDPQRIVVYQSKLQTIEPRNIRVAISTLPTGEKILTYTRLEGEEHPPRILLPE